MILIQVLVLVALVFIVLRMRPPEHALSPRLLSLLAAVAILSFGVAMGSIIIVTSERVFSLALLVAGISGAAFLWFARADPGDDDDDGGEPLDDLPPTDPDGGARRFTRKRTRATKPRVPSGPRG